MKCYRILAILSFVTFAPFDDLKLQLTTGIIYKRTSTVYTSNRFVVL